MPIEVQTCSTQNVLFVIPDTSGLFVVIVILSLMEVNINVIITTPNISKIF